MGGRDRMDKLQRWLLEHGDRLLITIGAAALIPMVSAPLNFAWLHWIALVPMFWVLREETPRANRWYGFLYGVVCVGLLYRWLMATIHVFSPTFSPFLAFLIMVVFSLAFGLPHVLLWAAVHPLRKKLGDGWILAIPALQVLIEYVSMYVLLFPYNQGVSQFSSPYVIQLSSITGLWGISFLLLFVNAAIAESIYREREGRPMPLRWISAAVATWSLVVMFGAWRYERIETALTAAPELHVGLMQTKKTMQHRFSQSRRTMLMDWVGETRNLIAQTEPGDVDLVVWSEGASPYNVHEGRTYDLIKRLTTKGGFELFVGGGTVTWHGDPREDEDAWVEAFNSVYLFSAEGEVEGRYDKLIPLPFGEYIPLANVFPWLKEMIKGPGSFRAGTEATVLEGTNYRIASPICYEAMLSHLCRRFDSPDLLVNPTNDAWFGNTAAPYQHAMLAAPRAVELGVPMVRSGFTGISMVVEPHGRIHSQTRPFTRSNKVVRVRMARFPTFYARYGNWFVLLCAAGLASSFLVAPWLRRE